MTALVLATFAEEGAFLRARLRAITEGHRIVGEWLPYAPAHETGERAILAWTVAGGLAGALVLFALENWSAGIAYRFVSGARSLWSWQAYLPAPVEFGAFTAALAGIARFAWAAGLTRLHHPAFDLEEVERASQDSFVLAVRCDAGADANRVTAFLAQAGATHSRVVTK